MVKVNVARPHSFLASAVHTDVLIVLARTSQPMTGREVARRAGRSQDRVRQVLEQLVEHGVVHRAEAGAALLFTLNRDHLATAAIERLTGLRGALLERLREEFGGWRIPPVSTLMFGSTARGDGNTASDIDLLVVRPSAIDEEDPTWRNQLDALTERVRTWTGNHAGLAEVGEDDLDELIHRDPPILHDLRADNIHLTGRRLTSLLKAAA